jgi:mannosylglycerate hydrolase MGH1-like protein
MHPSGQLPAYEWAFSDVNPPVHAWAALRVYRIERRRRGVGDRAFLERVFHKLLLNFTWWVNRKDAAGNNLFEGGFLGLDNIGPFDRSNMPVDGLLEQSDGTAWMAGYCLVMLTMALELARKDRAYDGMVTKFVEHFSRIAHAINEEGLWDEGDGFFYDRLRGGDGTRHVLRYRSLVGVIPLLAAITVEPRFGLSAETFAERFAAHDERNRGVKLGLPELIQMRSDDDGDRFLISLAGLDQLRRVLADVLSEESFLSPFGLRSLSRRHLDEPFRVEVDGVRAEVGYEPAESSSPMFGGNSNWRGPIWFPMNVSILESFERFHRFLGDGFKVECPTGSGNHMTLHEVADDLRRRLVSIFLLDADGRRPVNGGAARFHEDPDWRDLVTFNEYFHGDDGSGLGASHQTGWTGLVAHLIVSRRRVLVEGDRLGTDLATSA